MNYPIHDMSPYLWEWGNGWGIRYYGLAYFMGFLAYYWGMLWFKRKGWVSITKDQLADLLTWVVIGVLVGGRLGYCLVYDWQTTVRDPLSIVAFWRGGISGMSIHGGVLGALVAMAWFAQKNKVALSSLLDSAAILCTPGIFLGRIANFINGELWGRVTNVPWAIIFPQARDGMPRHPSQLYQALGEGLLLFIVLLWLRWKGWSGGRVAGMFLVLYGLIRIGLEFFREADAQIGYLWLGWSMGQWLSIGMIAVGVMVLLKLNKSSTL